MTCADRPCYNGGTCHQNIDSFTCICPDIYEGETCEIVNISSRKFIYYF